jgi:hypothetical protein
LFCSPDGLWNPQSRTDRESIKRKKSAFINYSSEFTIALDGNDESRGKIIEGEDYGYEETGNKNGTTKQRRGASLFTIVATTAATAAAQQCHTHRSGDAER